MVIDAEKHTGPVFATVKDDRVTSIGKVLRASRIDEFPQFFNVLKGDMTRSERPFFVDQFNRDIEEFKYRTAVKAGVTGLAQVLGRYTTSPRDKAKYGLLYIKNYSISLDIKIIFHTIKVMLIKESSAGINEKEKKEKEVQEAQEV